jgi:hypothetical protein
MYRMEYAACLQRWVMSAVPHVMAACKPEDFVQNEKGMVVMRPPCGHGNSVETDIKASHWLTEDLARMPVVGSAGSAFAAPHPTPASTSAGSASTSAPTSPTRRTAA